MKAANDLANLWNDVIDNMKLSSFFRESARFNIEFFDCRQVSPRRRCSLRLPAMNNAFLTLGPNWRPLEYGNKKRPNMMTAFQCQRPLFSTHVPKDAAPGRRSRGSALRRLPALSPARLPREALTQRP